VELPQELYLSFNATDKGSKLEKKLQKAGNTMMMPKTKRKRF
jgi:hypothetical protein